MGGEIFKNLQSGFPLIFDAKEYSTSFFDIGIKYCDIIFRSFENASSKIPSSSQHRPRLRIQKVHNTIIFTTLTVIP